jgi:hypothetical protein
MYDREKAAERTSRAADLVAQLREWDTEVADLRLEIAALTKVETGSGEGAVDLPSIHIIPLVN